MSLNVRRSSGRYGNRRVSVVNTARVKIITGRAINGNGSVKAVVSERHYEAEQ